MSTNIPPVTRLSATVTRILGYNPGPMTLQGTNTYLLGTGVKRILLDTGEKEKPDYINTLKNVLSSENITLEHVIISHWHRDHIGGLKDVISSVAPNCKVWKYRRSDINESDYVHDILVHKLEDNQEFLTEGATIKILYTPGHTTDHICLALKEENAIFSADCILGEGTSVFEDLREYLKSLRKLQYLNASVIYPGHGPVINNPFQKIEQYISHRLKRENEILDLLSTSTTKKEWSAQDLVMTLYKETPEKLLGAALWNVHRHMQKLLDDDKVVYEDDKWKIRTKSNL